ncbi:hypothetical protein ONS95_006319 [Cadophora gregata]|uniref:uncharacterized protein n=1 Tax=Cadophora gregata TaxID=51156 RepID=UPI0026DCFE16|nr:uncharacterized protein ONS95_006319 [Cadophora gregata]KAK0102717.1 hypothetical protein ONS95_006319 [Cadophora gregata]
MPLSVFLPTFLRLDATVRDSVPLNNVGCNLPAMAIRLLSAYRSLTEIIVEYWLQITQPLIITNHTRSLVVRFPTSLPPLQTVILVITASNPGVRSLNRLYNCLSMNTMASTTELYHHAPFTDVRSIRLLFLQPGQFDDVINVRLKVFSLDDLPPYCALSYAWGPPPHTTPVSCYGKKLLASESCVAALRRLRDTIEEKVLWIDAICIDQTSLSERGHQVNLMCGVYSKAERTWIWLGESTPETDFMIDFLGDYHKVLDATKDYFPGSTDNLLLLEIEKLKAEERRLYGVECATLFDLLIGKPWFCRVWTV